MEKLLRARRSLAQNSKKGFTLVELIVVIVIIAILIAALLPAVFGAIERANEAADQSDARAIMTAASVWAQGLTDAQRTAQLVNGTAPTAFLQLAPADLPPGLPSLVPGFDNVETGSFAANPTAPTIVRMEWDVTNGFCTAIVFVNRSNSGVYISIQHGAGVGNTLPANP